MSKILRFLKSDDGPTAIEYAVMMAVIIVVCIAGIRAIGTKTSTSFNTCANSMGS